MTKGTIHIIQQMKENPSAPPSAQSQRKAAVSASTASSSLHRDIQLHQPGPSRTPVAGPLELTEESRQAPEDYRPMEDDNEEAFVPASTVRSSAYYLSRWDAYARDKNKENRPLPAQEKGKKRFIDQQANAQKVRWSSQDSQESEGTAAGRSKRRRAQVEPDDDDNSQDEGFEADQRNPNPNLRAPRRVSPAPVRGPSPKRARVQEDGAAARAARRRQQREEAALQANARREASDEEFEEEDEIEDATSRTAATQVLSTARRETAISKQSTAQPQNRTPWSPEDTEHLIDLIEDMGCSWAVIHKAGGFQVERDQVAIKDKARNLKVAFLK